MKEIFDLLLNEYLLDKSKTTNKNAEYHIMLVNELPKKILSNFSEDKYMVKGSDGNGNKSAIPWFGIFDKRLATSARKGIYICYLFKSDMSGFYLTLTQGFTVYEKKYGRYKYEYAELVSKYFQKRISDANFSYEKINLVCKNILAKGYCSTTILSKYYEKENYTEDELQKDLLIMKEIYKQLADNFTGVEYEQLIDSIINDFDTYAIDEVERKEIEQELLDLNGEKEAVVRTLERVEFPKSKKTKKESTRVIEKTVKKIDHIKKLRKNIDTGIMGEMLVLDYEKDRLKQLGYNDLAQKVRWIANVDDSKGYDIESYDVDENGKYEQIYIEVKTTDGNANSPFFISKNEAKQIEVHKEKYYIYRVYNINSNKPSLFVINYKDYQKKIKLEAELFRAEIEN